MPANIIQIKRINESLYLLNENIREGAYITMMLDIGKEKAALIDTGMGVSGDLDAVIHSITDKPVICLLTHCDPDHAGGAALFDDIYMSSLDEPLMKNSLSYRARSLMVRNMTDSDEVRRCVKESMVRKGRFDYHNVIDGDVFDLGGCKLEAVSLGGHTKGSMCYIDRAGKYIFSGDSIANANSAVLFFDKCLPLSAYRNNLAQFLQFTGQDVDIYSGHATDSLDSRIIPELLILCDEIIAGDTADDAPYVPPFLQTLPEKSIKGVIRNAMLGIVAKMQFGSARPMEHTKPGFLASVKYNANKI